MAIAKGLLASEESEEGDESFGSLNMPAQGYFSDGIICGLKAEGVAAGGGVVASFAGSSSGVELRNLRLLGLSRSYIFFCCLASFTMGFDIREWGTFAVVIMFLFFPSGGASMESSSADSSCADSSCVDSLVARFTPEVQPSGSLTKSSPADSTLLCTS